MKAFGAATVSGGGLTSLPMEAEAESSQWEQVTKLTASDGEFLDRFGWSVDIDGNTAVIGTQRAFAAYVFEFDGETWTETQKLTAGDGDAVNSFGFSVALDGDSALIGAIHDDSGRGAAHVFRFNGETWTETQKLTASDREFGDNFGWSVALDGDTALVGARNKDESDFEDGAAYVFEFDGEGWTETQKLTASDGESRDRFGWDVALDVTTAVIGTQRADAAYVFEFDGGMWAEAQKLTASDSDTVRFGTSVALDGGTSIIHAGVADAGYVFDFDGETWTETQKITASDGELDGRQNNTVDLDGKIAVIGAEHDSIEALFAGAAYVFDSDGEAWAEAQKLTASDAAEGDHFGHSVALDGTTAIVGSDDDDNVNAERAGAAYIFEGPPQEEKANLQLQDVRLVQTVENTRVGDSSKKIKENNYDNEIDGPSLVEGRKTTAVFDLGLENLDPQRFDSPVLVTITHGGSSSPESFGLTPETVRKAVDNTSEDRSLVDIIMEDRPEKRDDWPIFEVEDGDTVGVEVSTNDDSITGDAISMDVGSTSWPVTEMPELNIGVIRVENPDSYGSVSDSEYESIVDNIAFYLQQVYPTSRVNVLRSKQQILGEDDPDSVSITPGGDETHVQDIQNAHSTLNSILPASNNSEGEIVSVEHGIHVSGPDKIESFDETLAIAPGDYFNEPQGHDNPDTLGLHWAWDSDLDGDGVPDLQPATSSIVIAHPGVETTAAMEMGHHFLSNQYPEFLAEDPQKRIHLASDVYSTKYNLESGILTAEGGVRSFMNDLGTWTDGKTHQLLIDGGFDPVASVGSLKNTVLTVFGVITDEFTVQLQQSSQQKTGFVPDVNEGGAVTSIRDPNGNQLDERNIPTELTSSHSGGSNGAIQAIVASLPFPEEAHTVSFSIENPSTGEITTTTVNPLAAVLFDSISNIPDDGFVRNPDQYRHALNEKLAEIEEKMDAKQFHDARQKLENDIRQMIELWLKDDYEAAANQYTMQEMLDLVDDMIGRLETLAEESS